MTYLLKPFLHLVLLLAAFSALTACGGSSSSNNTTPLQEGDKLTPNKDNAPGKTEPGPIDTTPKLPGNEATPNNTMKKVELFKTVDWDFGGMSGVIPEVPARQYRFFNGQRELDATFSELNEETIEVDFNKYQIFMHSNGLRNYDESYGTVTDLGKTIEETDDYIRIEFYDYQDLRNCPSDFAYPAVMRQPEFYFYKIETKKPVFIQEKLVLETKPCQDLVLEPTTTK